MNTPTHMLVAVAAFARPGQPRVNAAALIGGVFLAVCDWLSQTVMGAWSAITSSASASASLPIGVVTAIVGVPIFLVLLYMRGGLTDSQR